MAPVSAAVLISIFLMMCFGFSSAIPLSFLSPPAQGSWWFKTHTTALPFYWRNNTKRGLGHLWSPGPPSVAHLEVVCRSSNWKSICLKLCIWHLARFIKSLEIAFNFTASRVSPGTFSPLPPFVLQRECMWGLAIRVTWKFVEQWSGCGL